MTSSIIHPEFDGNPEAGISLHDGQIVSKHMTDRFTIAHDNVTLKDCRIGTEIVIVPGVEGTVIEDCSIG